HSSQIATLSLHDALPILLLTAPGKDDIKNIVYGINHDTIQAQDSLLSAASCTTNAIVPVLKAVSDAYGISHGHVETVHSYTNDRSEEHTSELQSRENLVC